MKIARGFNRGMNREKGQSPAGAAEISFVPPGLGVFFRLVPALKCRAIVGGSCGTEPGYKMAMHPITNPAEHQT
jgi:hypothetical protein